VKKYIAAIEHAAAQTARVMGAQLRTSAINDGWHPDAASSLSVEYKDGKFVANSSSGHAFDHEFGTETSIPKATVRNYGKNSHHHAGGVFNGVLNNRLQKGKK
jgi:hypothetical protein